MSCATDCAGVVRFALDVEWLPVHPEDTSVLHAPSTPTSDGSTSHGERVCASADCTRLRNCVSRKCCIECPDRHTRTCQRAARTSGASVPPASETASTPPPPDEFFCPICIEMLPVSRRATLPCSHVLCSECKDTLSRYGFVACPLCRADSTASSSTAHTPTTHNTDVAIPMYVILRASSENRQWLGLHVVGWQQAEERLQVPRGTLAGNLRHNRLQLRKASSVDVARCFWCAYHRDVPMPIHD